MLHFFSSISLLCHFNSFLLTLYNLIICRIKHTYVLDDPFDDSPQLAELIPENSPTGRPRDEVIEYPNHVHFSNKRGRVEMHHS